MDLNYFYGRRLPKFADIFRDKVQKKLEAGHLLMVKNYLKIFLDFFEENNAFTCFKDFNIIRDSITVSAFINNYNNKISFERQICIEDCDEEYQIRCELIFDISPLKDVYYYFDIERDQLNDFFNTDLGYLYMSDFEKIILESEEMKQFADNIPKDFSIVLNADH
ncbi:hypothetical protein [Flavobacterium gelatinilyticum]|uniref:hypothetical protein n=1 Tax=Flavobacterium gelatinilyticum TaxID=3003260 RepID=UPI0024808B22|nr:hypothetical protein [Flavobacterium gelatinilyticum]